MRFTIPGVPITKKNSQQIVKSKHGLMILPSKKFRDYQKSVADYIPFRQSGIDTKVNL